METDFVILWFLVLVVRGVNTTFITDECPTDCTEQAKTLCSIQVYKGGSCPQEKYVPSAWPGPVQNVRVDVDYLINQDMLRCYARMGISWDQPLYNVSALEGFYVMVTSDNADISVGRGECASFSFNMSQSAARHKMRFSFSCFHEPAAPGRRYTVIVQPLPSPPEGPHTHGRISVTLSDATYSYDTNKCSPDSAETSLSPQVPPKARPTFKALKAQPTQSLEPNETEISEPVFTKMTVMGVVLAVFAVAVVVTVLLFVKMSKRWPHYRNDRRGGGSADPLVQDGIAGGSADTEVVAVPSQPTEDLLSQLSLLHAPSPHMCLPPIPASPIAPPSFISPSDVEDSGSEMDGISFTDSNWDDASTQCGGIYDTDRPHIYPPQRNVSPRQPPTSRPQRPVNIQQPALPIADSLPQHFTNQHLHPNQFHQQYLVRQAVPIAPTPHLRPGPPLTQRPEPQEYSQESGLMSEDVPNCMYLLPLPATLSPVSPDSMMSGVLDSGVGPSMSLESGTPAVPTIYNAMMSVGGNNVPVKGIPHLPHPGDRWGIRE